MGTPSVCGQRASHMSKKPCTGTAILQTMRGSSPDRSQACEDTDTAPNILLTAFAIY
jgi:hypothetical protein